MKTGFKTLGAYKISYELAMIIFNLTKAFPKEETYSLTDQVRRSSRSICVNFAEAYRKRLFIRHFVSKLTDCDAECSETQVWLELAKDCQYITTSQYNEIILKYIDVGNLLGDMINNPEKYQEKPRSKNTVQVIPTPK